MSAIRIGKKWPDRPRGLELRPLEDTPQDLAALATVRNETLRATTLREDFRELSPDDVLEYYSRGGFSLRDNAWLMTRGGVPVAAAIVFPMHYFPDRPPGNFHIYVVPDAMGHGLGSRLLAHLEQAAAHRGHPVLETTVAREDRHSAGFLSGHGFEVVGASLQLARHLEEDPPSPQLPEGYGLASLAALGDGPGFYAETVNRLAAYDTDHILVRYDEAGEDSVDAREPDRGAIFLTAPGGRVVGVIRAETAAAGRGYLSGVRLEPSSRGRGLGLALVNAALRFLRQEGVNLVELRSSGENQAALILARRAGFEATRHWLHFLKRLAAPAPAPGRAGDETGTEGTE